MSTNFIGDGNIGTKPEYRLFPNGNEEPRKLLRLNVRFDNPIPIKGGGFEDRGGFWAPVELWHQEAETWSKLYQRGMRVLVSGRMVCQKWSDEEGIEHTTYKIEARFISILPQRIKSIEMQPSNHENTQETADEPDSLTGAETKKES